MYLMLKFTQLADNGAELCVGNLTFEVRYMLLYIRLTHKAVELCAYSSKIVRK
jgi:hypothetical protein